MSRGYMTNGEWEHAKLACEVRDRFVAALGEETHTRRTSMIGVSPSALADHILLRWIGLAAPERELRIRINPLGLDLDEVLAEFAARCRAASATPSASSSG